MKIYEIDDRVRELMRNSIDEDGVVNEDAMTEIDGLSLAKDEKILNFGKFISEKKAEILAMKDAEKKISARRKSLEKSCERSEEYLMTCLDGPVSDSCIKVSKRRSERLTINDEDAFIAEYSGGRFVIEKTTRTIDKNETKKGLLTCGALVGAEITEHYSLQIK